MTAGTVVRRISGGILLVGALVLMAAPHAGAAPPEDKGPNVDHGNGVGVERRSEHAAVHTAATVPEDLESPQPPSNADFTGSGANVHGPYDSTRDGSPSENGVGDGIAANRPCAGCVGKADNKNPPGQLPGGSDDNAGYECDRNEGVGKTNPAHTGCVTARVVTTTTTSTTSTSTSTTSTTASTTITTAATGAQVLGVSLTAPPAAVAGAQAERRPAVAALGATGAGMTIALTASGLALLVAGSVLLMWRPKEQ